jgi:hypothetical protein
VAVPFPSLGGTRPPPGARAAELALAVDSSGVVLFGVTRRVVCGCACYTREGLTWVGQGRTGRLRESAFVNRVTESAAAPVRLWGANRLLPISLTPILDETPRRGVSFRQPHDWDISVTCVLATDLPDTSACSRLSIHQGGGRHGPGERRT